jgi:hypothetical protein
MVPLSFPDAEAAEDFPDHRLVDILAGDRPNGVQHL